MSTFDRLSGLPLTIEGYDLETREQNVSSGFLRLSTTFLLRGDGHAGARAASQGARRGRR